MVRKFDVKRTKIVCTIGPASSDEQVIREMIRAGMDVKRAVARTTAIEHPLDPTLNGLYGTIITDEPSNDTLNGRNIVIFADGEVDRSPCGTGTSARMAQLWARGELSLHQDFINESFIGRPFIGRLVEETTVGSVAAVVPTITGRAWVTGTSQFMLDPTDPFPAGFLL